MELKDRLKELRNETGISAGALGEKLGKAESTVRMWEIGKAKPDIDTLVNLAHFFCCSTDYMLGLTDYKNIDYKVNYESNLKELSDHLEAININDRIAIISTFKSFSYAYGFNEGGKERDRINQTYNANLQALAHLFSMASFVSRCFQSNKNHSPKIDGDKFMEAVYEVAGKLEDSIKSLLNELALTADENEVFILKKNRDFGELIDILAKNAQYDLASLNNFVKNKPKEGE